MRSVSILAGIASFNRRKNARFGELGIRARSDNFSHEGMTQWGAPRVWGAPKSICTHVGTRLKKIAEKWRFSGPLDFSGPNGRKSCLGRADHQNLSIYPRTPQNIHILSIASLEQILWLCENGSQNGLWAQIPLEMGCKFSKNFKSWKIHQKTL